jgi:prepilin-type N-terminal cleavage/methylation domain-containing protein
MVSISQLQRREQLGARNGGFSLVEVMVSAVIAAIVLTSAIASILMAMRTSLEVRYQDRALSALKSVADQFQNSPVTDQSTGGTKALFTATNGVETGYGMAWDTTKQAFTYPPAAASASIIVGTPNNAATAGSLDVPLGTVDTGQGVDAAVMCSITREVSAVTDAAVTTNYGGTLMEGVFRARYTVFNKQKQLQIRVLRNINPSDS